MADMKQSRSGELPLADGLPGPIAEMLIRREIAPATSDSDISDIEPLPPRLDGVILSDVLLEMRNEGR